MRILPSELFAIIQQYEQTGKPACKNTKETC